MIRVQPQQEPAEFQALVREPGLAYLQQVPHPTSKEFASRDYWTRVLPKLGEAYGRICAFSCHYIPRDTGGATVEHFRPKSVHPADAYEWSNYRFVCRTLNGRKGVFNVLDPFVIQDGWFVLEFSSLLVKPAPDLVEHLKDAVRYTCRKLGLNHDGTCLKAREDWVESFCKNQISFEHLVSRAPFIASEIVRQGYRYTLNNVMGY